MKYILSLDQGTTSSRSILFNQLGQAVCTAQKEFTQFYPHQGWVEHDPLEILQTQLETAREVIEKKGISAEDISAIGITNQRETTILWDKRSGRPLCNGIVWQCRRTAPFCDELKEKGYADFFHEKTGLLIDAYFSATKIKWILDNIKGAKELAAKGNLLFGTIDTWLIWNLTGGQVHATDYSNASRTMLFNIHTLKWDTEILDLLEIPINILPKVVPSSGVLGYSIPALLGSSIPISGVAGDQQAALFGQACFSPGAAKNTYGTGCFLLMNTGDVPVTSKNGLLTTIAWGLDDKITYALEGSVFVAGAAIQWLRDELKMISSADETEDLCRSVQDTCGVYLVPAFTGLGAPHWDPYARGILTGLTRGANRAHIVRAAVESMAYQTYDVLHAMEQDAGIPLAELRVDGGAAANSFLLQFQSDITGVPVMRPSTLETTALGAAYLAGLAVGYWKNLTEIRRNWQVSFAFSPQVTKEAAETKYLGWKNAVNQALYKKE
ncbi:glycerol kinase GlpK [Anaerotignum sp.]|uniref:glycerol kinase GlpK n=1 Tax=Anaerotignum sp. TaxID=2039241 RepID=UPI0028A86661|nr:glycerol kinase GlpK [Anaerotignum sp.]